MAATAENGGNERPEEVQPENVAEETAKWRHDSAYRVRNTGYFVRLFLGHVVLVLEVVTGHERTKRQLFYRNLRAGGWMGELGFKFGGLPSPAVRTSSSFLPANADEREDGHVIRDTDKAQNPEVHREIQNVPDVDLLPSSVGFSVEYAFRAFVEHCHDEGTQQRHDA